MFDHVLVIMFENQYRGYVKRNPYFARLARDGVELANAFGVMHPSQTNYIASIAGELCNVTSDGPPAPLAQRTIVDLIEAQGAGLEGLHGRLLPALQPWADDLPRRRLPLRRQAQPLLLVREHLGRAARWARSSGRRALDRPPAGALPQFGWFTPDMWNDGHYIRRHAGRREQRAPALVDQAAHWLQSFFATLRFPGPDSLLPPRTLVVVTFDESDFEATSDRGRQGTPTTAPTRSTPSCSATSSSPAPSSTRATATTACCAPSRRTSASGRSARTTPTATGCASCGASASPGASSARRRCDRRAAWRPRRSATSCTPSTSRATGWCTTCGTGAPGPTRSRSRSPARALRRPPRRTARCCSSRVRAARSCVRAAGGRRRPGSCRSTTSRPWRSPRAPAPASSCSRCAAPTGRCGRGACAAARGRTPSTPASVPAARSRCRRSVTACCSSTTRTTASWRRRA